MGIVLVVVEIAQCVYPHDDVGSATYSHPSTFYSKTLLFQRAFSDIIVLSI